MANEMYAVPGETLTGIADAIRSKTGSDEQMPVFSMADAIIGISASKQSIVHDDDWVSGYTTQDFADRYLSRSTGDVGCTLAVVNNTYSGSQTAYTMQYAIAVAGLTNTIYGFVRGQNSLGLSTTLTTGCCVGAGSVIDIYNM